MSFYRERVLPHVVELTCGGKRMIPIRRPALERLRGTVLEIGFGSGPNIGLYPEEVERVLAVEPSARAQEGLDAAEKHGGRGAGVGRSMVRNRGGACDLGLLRIPDGIVVDRKQVEQLARNRVLLVSTGAQGEPLSALSRMANRSHHQVRIEEDDTVVLASSLIPGNENAVYRVINGLSRWGARVVHKGVAKVHVSGHAPAGELLFLLNAVRPSNLMPVHGEWRHLRAHAELGRLTGVENVVLAEDGVVVDLVDGRASIVGAVECGYGYVDGLEVGGVRQHGHPRQ